MDIWHEYSISEKTKHSHRLLWYKPNLCYGNSFEHIICEQLFKWQEHTKTQENHQREICLCICTFKIIKQLSWLVR